ARLGFVARRRQTCGAAFDAATRRQTEQERCALLLIVRKRQFAAVFARNRAAYRQANAGTRTFRLGSKERIKNPLAHIVGNTGAVVADTHILLPRQNTGLDHLVTIPGSPIE